MWPYCITLTLQIQKLITVDKQCEAKMPEVIYIYVCECVCVTHSTQSNDRHLNSQLFSKYTLNLILASTG